MVKASVFQNWPAPAKLNLMLRIVGRREDGYHLLQTVFQFVDCCDFLHFEILSTPQITLTTPLAGVPPEQDLTVRAARLLQNVSGTNLGVRISLDKRLPMGGGLGGGSSDAATVLVALNHLWDLGLDGDQLVRLGLQLGADVPVFVKGVSAWAEGIGEHLTPLLLPEPWYVILVPPCQVATAAVFSADDLTRNSPPVKINSFLAGMEVNDCWPVVRRLYPQVEAAWKQLSQFGEARLTGTGACVFVAVDDKDQARKIEQSLGDSWQVLVAQGRNRSPLLEKLTQVQKTK